MLFGLPLILLAVGFNEPDPPLPPLLPVTIPLPSAPPSESPWDAWLYPDRAPRKVKSESTGDWGTIKSQTIHADWRDDLLWEDPLRKREWKTEQAWRYDVLGPFFAYGNLGANSEEAVKQTKVTGKTGVACKVPLIWDAEVTLRSGPSVTYSDPFRPDYAKQRSEWLLEVQARCPLLAGIGLEYEGVAVPALSPLDKNALNQDVRLAFPVGNTGKFKVGAKHRWEMVPEPRPWSEGMQLYLGLEWTR
jgi:hypothetical protein